MMYVPKEKSSKLDNKAKKCIFVSSKDGIKVYKTWNPVTRKMVQSQDAIFKGVKNTLRNEDETKENGPQKMEFGIKNERSYCFEKESST